MSRLLAGLIESSGAGTNPHWSALASERTRVIARGPLRVAIEGPEPVADEPLVIFDGVLDNAIELAAHLGCPSTDPEHLIGLGYRRLGAGIVSRLHGDFALLIWDGEQRQGLLARDRIGAGGLYLRTDGRRLWFASEIAHLLALLPSRPAPDRVSVTHWVGLSARPGPQTLFEGITRLEPGCLLALGEARAAPRRYWQPRFREPEIRTAPAFVAELREGLERSVRARTAREGRTGVLMSGGLDSATVAALTAREDPVMLACSGVFPGHAQVDESTLIAGLREQLGVSGIEASVEPGGLIAAVLEHLDAWQCPPLGWSDFWTLPLLREASRKGVTVTLGGDGGDELFGVRAYLLADELRASRPRAAMKLSRRLPGGGQLSRRQRARVLQSLALAGALGPRTHALLASVRPRTRAPSWLNAGAAHLLSASDDPYAWKRLDGPRWWAHPAHALTQGIEQAGILEHQRRRAALAGLRARHPLLDPVLLELALCQEPSLSFDPELTRPLLREAMNGLLPEQIRLRPGKAWFDSLIADCITGPDGAATRALLTAPDTRVGEYLRPGAAHNALETLASANGVPRFEAMHLLWRLLGAECWLRAQENDGTAPALDDLSAPRVAISRHPARPRGVARRTSGKPTSIVFPPPRGPRIA